MEGEPKITTEKKTQKTKDPRKVEAGKRLAAISKAAKERKVIERQAATKVPDVDPTNVIAYSVAVVVVLGGLIYSRYGGKSEPEAESEPEDKPEEAPKRPSLKNKKKISVK